MSTDHSMWRITHQGQPTEGIIDELHEEINTLQEEVKMLYCIVKQHPELNEILQHQRVVNKLKGESSE